LTLGEDVEHLAPDITRGADYNDPIPHFIAPNIRAAGRSSENSGRRLYQH
jgi:hypothetical protein